MKQINGYETKQQQGILLNANESASNLDVVIAEEIGEAIKKVAFNRYPDDEMRDLRTAYGKYIGVSEKQIIAGNGSDEMLGLLISLYIKEGKKLYTMANDFSMYDYYVSMQAGTLVHFDWKLGDTFDVEEFIRVGKENKVDLIIFSNPNNPTGRVVSVQDIQKIVTAFDDIVVVIDEAYVEFGDESMVTHLDTYANLLVTRTLSKAFGLAGIRCGFLLGSEALIHTIAPYKVPYNVNTLTQVSACITLQHTEEILDKVAQVKKLRDKMYEAYQALHLDKVTLYPSKANYLYGMCKDKERLLTLLAAVSIRIRTYDNDYFRITIGNEADNQKVLAILAAV